MAWTCLIDAATAWSSGSTALVPVPNRLTPPPPEVGRSTPLTPGAAKAHGLLPLGQHPPVRPSAWPRVAATLGPSHGGGRRTGRRWSRERGRGHRCWGGRRTSGLQKREVHERQVWLRGSVWNESETLTSIYIRVARLGHLGHDIFFLRRAILKNRLG